MTTARMSAREVAAKFLTLKTNSSKAAVALIDDAASRAEGKTASKKLRWTRLADAMRSNDREAVLRYADYAAWADKQKAAKAAKPKAKPAAKAATKAKAKPAKAKPAAKAAPKAEAKPDVGKFADAFGVDRDVMAAFLELAAK